MLVLHLENQGPRSSPIVNQGLLSLGITFEIINDYHSLGRLVKAGTPFTPELARSADLILNGCPLYVNEFDRLDLWHKVVHYDYSDWPTLTETQRHIKPRAMRYYKRSRFDRERRLHPDCADLLPLDYCCMEEYFAPERPRPYDVGCFFALDNPILGKRRRNLLLELMAWNPPRSIIGHSTGYGTAARRGVSDNPHNNPFIQYRDLLHQCKIIFTAFPENYDGDNRTWEAMASGALVFKDVSMIEVGPVLEDGVHCVHYDASCVASIRQAIEKAAWYLANDGEREKVARAGREHVRRHHMPADRVRWLIIGG